jgi:ATP-binding cassette, subfamily G (WHITE), member 2, PDR
MTGSVACVAIYQAPQPAYDQFDKVTVFYEGYQIYFGPARDAKKFFVDMGFFCAEQQTTPDFLTGLTSPTERKVRSGFEGKVPRTPVEFARAWKASDTYKALAADLATYDERYPTHGEMLERFQSSRRAQQSKHLCVSSVYLFLFLTDTPPPRSRPKSPFTLSYIGQVKLCLIRGFWRLKSDPSLTYAQLFGNSSMALIVSSVFYNLPQTTASFYSRGSLL